MRDTSDMMEDAMSEDAMMDCEGDGSGLDDLLDLAGHITDSASTIRDAAERLLTLLGVDDSDLLSSEDEGVDCDPEDPLITESPHLLHNLAASLASELKYAQKRRKPSEESCMELGHEVMYVPEARPTSEVTYSTSDEYPRKRRRSGGENASSWCAGWDACAAEAVRYLLEDEGLESHDPTVVNLKNHLEIQRIKALASFS